MFPKNLLLVALLPALSLSLIAPVSAQRSGPSPRFTGTALPEPPQQKTAWKPAAGDLPTVLVSATAALFEEGLADPRGCPYREVQVVVGSVWGGGGIEKTHGWVMPHQEGATGDFAVLPDGLVYPIVSSGPPADLRADVLAMVQADEAMRARWAKDHPEIPFYRYRNSPSEPESTSSASLLPIKACLLIRLGETELASRLWIAYTAGMRANTNDDAIHLRDPYLMLAGDWAWALFDRAVCAHMRGDDLLSLLSARLLNAILPAIDTEAEARKFERPRSYTTAAPGEKTSYLSFLETLPALLADEERRVRESRPGSLIPATSAKIPDQTARIAALVRDLDEVSARQWGQPGGVILGEDPIVQALIAEGDAAVEPLLNCLENDTRLTRSVRFGRDFSPYRSLMGVHEAAYVSLAGILHTSFFGAGTTADDLTAHGSEGRKQVAAAIRQYWIRFKNVPVEERWYRTLADDKATSAEWLQAAGNIVQPGDTQVIPGSTLGGGISISMGGMGPKKPLKGEILRTGKTPTVSELMARRVDDITKRAEAMLSKPGYEPTWEMEGACTMALHLADWDLPAALPVLQQQIMSSTALLQKLNPGYAVTSWGSSAPLTTQMMLARKRGNDPHALSDYAAWLRILPVNGVVIHIQDIFEPLWVYAKDPAVAEAAEWLFGSKESPWVPLLQPRPGAPVMDEIARLLHTPLLGLRPFRAEVIRELCNTAKAGTLKIKDDGEVDATVDGLWSGGGGSAKFDPLAPMAYKDQTFRTCDLCAWELSLVDGLPQCELYWPEAQRDHAVAACKSVLEQYGDRFAYSTQDAALFVDYGSDKMTHPTFSVLDHPATRAEVRQGLAIFSLEGEGQVRQVSGLHLPAKAKWPGLKDYPFERQEYDKATGKYPFRKEYLQDGMVWQAEEILKGGVWHRYYGFAGSHRIAKVSAEELQLDFKGTD